MIRDAINRVIWSGEDLKSFTIVVRDRVKVVAEIPFTDLEAVDRHYLYLKDGNVIPLHRVLEIRRNDETLWHRYSKKTT
ncbi:DUF504 domain-containing protein [Metallosphaera tengchongensis]|uniref:UPF0248 protein GWK48_03540 n=1 Tax=Metallosphaera tengchongensis TaxID=1532350 RepID=A0A6N0NSA9_9CREN|nr:DUF504 domain-containing protein [Metallosphaera tengchongensis]QKQ99591.1 DUF504 domain-containing protein [Metallosphaera tengchongensis]